MMPEINSTLATIGWPAAVVLVAWAMKPVWAALATKLSKNGGNGHAQAIKELQSFKETAETNHFDHFEKLAENVERIEKDFIDFRIQSENRFTRLESKVLNGQLKQP